MADSETEIVRNTNSQVSTQTESSLFGVSIRSIIVSGLSLTVCAMAIMAKTVEEPLYSGFMISLGYYFGTKQGSTTTITPK